MFLSTSIFSLLSQQPKITQAHTSKADPRHDQDLAADLPPADWPARQDLLSAAAIHLVINFA